MAYVIYEKTSCGLTPIKNRIGDVIIFKSKLISEIERIYLQPNYNNLLVVKKVKV
jgi:hypothetical protein